MWYCSEVDSHGNLSREALAVFASSGVIQLVGSLLSLWTFTSHLARARKASAIGIAYLYIAGGLLGALLSVNLSTALPATGAPAAVCALIGEPHACQPACWSPLYFPTTLSVFKMILFQDVVAVSGHSQALVHAVHEDEGKTPPAHGVTSIA